MATRFKKGDAVKLNVVVPGGPILAYRMDDDGVVYCLLEWVDVDGSTQQRWFKEDDLIGA
jgi:uncharacterized protein YodC (DUF2158 family)